MPAEDALELLLPDADPQSMRRARSVTHFLRLLSDDARSRRASSVGVDLERARGELERHARLRLEAALGDLLRHHLSAVAGGSTFVTWGEAARPCAAAWRTLEDLRDEIEGLAEVPGPGEPALSVAERLIACLERVGAEPGELALWRARHARLAHGARAAECLLRAELERARGDGAPAPVLAPRLAQVVECLLDRGALREVQSMLGENAALVAADVRLRQLASWAATALGDQAAASRLLAGVPTWTGVLPDALLALRDRLPELLALLPGRRPEPARAAGRVEDGAGVARADLGAALLALFAREVDGTVRALHVEVAPGWRDALPAWLAARGEACFEHGSPEHELLVGARAVVRDQREGRAIAGALGGGATRALALTPLLGNDGDVRGWLHVECEHHLLPSRERLARVAVVLDREPRAADGAATAPEPEAAFDDPVAAVFRAAIEALAIKTCQRRWWGFEVERGEARLVASGGDGVGLPGRVVGGRRALARALSAAGTVAWDEREPALSIDGEAASGVVFPLRAVGRAVGLLAIESSRRRDFRAGDLARHRSALESFALPLCAARFRRHHRDAHGADVAIDAERPEGARAVTDLLAAARTLAPVVLGGPPGSGRHVLARWVHFESALAGRALCGIACDAADSVERVARRLASEEPCTVVLDDLERLPGPAQLLLARRLEGRDGVGVGAARWIATLEPPLCEAVAAGRLRADLALRLERLQLRIRPLCERREEIVPLLRTLIERCARELGRRAPDCSDEALALLWRQPWPGNVRELEAFAFKLALLGTRTIEAADVAAIAARFGTTLLDRLPSRHPRREDLIAALRTTRRALGRANKTRAAAFLGWDPDTLVARMQDAGLDERQLDDPHAATEGAPEAGASG